MLYDSYGNTVVVERRYTEAPTLGVGAHELKFYGPTPQYPQISALLSGTEVTGTSATADLGATVHSDQSPSLQNVHIMLAFSRPLIFLVFPPPNAHGHVLLAGMRSESSTFAASHDTMDGPFSSLKPSCPVYLSGGPGYKLCRASLHSTPLSSFIGY